MGSAPSITQGLSDENQFKLYKELKESYEKRANGELVDESDFLYYKSKYEEFMKKKADCQEEIKLTMNELSVGDIVFCISREVEGIIIDVTENGFLVDIGEKRPLDISRNDVRFILHGLDYEIGDKVQVKPPGSAIYFVGNICEIHRHGSNRTGDTYDINMGENDIERNVTAENMRKILSHRLIKKKLKKIMNTMHVLRTRSSSYDEDGKSISSREVLEYKRSAIKEEDDECKDC